MGAREITAPTVMNITSAYTFDKFDSLLLLDAGSDGFRITDSLGNTVVIPTGIPISIAGKAGQSSGPLTIIAPASGSLNVTAIFYS